MEAQNINGRPNGSLHLVTLNVGTVYQIRQQASLVKIVETPEVAVGRISETCMRDPTSANTVHSPDATSVSRFALRTSNNPVSSICGTAGVGTALGTRLDDRQQSFLYGSVGRFCAYQ